MLLGGGQPPPPTISCCCNLGTVKYFLKYFEKPVPPHDLDDYTYRIVWAVIDGLFCIL